jgi:hypothetical protein
MVLAVAIFVVGGKLRTGVSRRWMVVNDLGT